MPEPHTFPSHQAYLDWYKAYRQQHRAVIRARHKRYMQGWRRRRAAKPHPGAGEGAAR